jgi:SNW domain-containing protein 1
MSSKNSKDFLKKPSEEATLQNIYNTKKALEKLSNHRIKTYQSFKTNSLTSESNKNNNLCYKYINYQFDSNNNNPNSKPNSHLIKLVALPVDPLSNLKYRHHKIPLSNTNEKNFVPVLQSPPTPLSLEEQKKWKIPPCVNMSNNPKGLVIPLDIRLANDGRNLREYKANKNFAKFADILALTEKNVRKEIEDRNKIAQSIQIAAAMKKEQELKEAAKQARMERNSLNNYTISNKSYNNNSNMIYSLDTSDILSNKKEEKNFLKNKRERSINEEEIKEIKERNELREIRKKEIEYERRIEIMKKYEKEGRDVNDKVLLGQNNIINNNNVIDSRLYEVEGGIENPFDYEEDCEVYDKPLFNGKNKISNIYKNFNSSGGENSKKLMGKILSQKGKLFTNDIEVLNSRKEGPVQFEKSKEKE